MFGAMRSSRGVNVTPCPCNNICRCHRSHNAKKDLMAIGIFAFVMICLFLGLYFFTKNLPEKRYIEVDGKMCVVKFKEEGQTSTGAVWGHDIADCKNGKKTAN